ncbi:hypothetical protein CLV24_11937 [Pontibacter ummariensis]|uniref:SmpA / OmlA family protein n=1 Tax=Pontibacter ummariensis TaxID=1610492 RepID=A0A239IVP6_9BACT|nr:hypothetical protein [Pontibacter ummariensis]PRY08986.1 hypothetical protein CLV24_11937 [Pontibacter ummariensis]SNS97710.1 hypothetical protein SAMN06296052_11937 [Pontibacter ummariensis]
MNFLQKYKSVKITALIVGVVVILVLLMKGNIPHERFDSTKWKTADLNSEANWSLRWDMMNSLRNNHKLVGKSKSEIIELLGEPESKTNSTFRYYLGYSKNGINTGSLIIKFDAEGRVVDYQVWQG